MATVTPPLLSFNRGIISKTTMARTDLDRTRLSAEDMTNWLPKTQGPMIMRPGTKYSGSSLNDTGAFWIEFVASTDDLALLEMTDGKMRVWLPSDTGNDWETPVQPGVFVPMSRPAVDTTVSLADTGWYSDSLGGGTFGTGSEEDIIPRMLAETTDRVKITSSSANASSTTGGEGWNAADDVDGTNWTDTGWTSGAPYNSTLPSWLNVNFDTGGTDTGNRVALSGYAIVGADFQAAVDNSPRAWRLLASNHDTGSYANDTGKWTLEDEQTEQIAWTPRLKRAYPLPGNDTGTVEARRHWRLYFTEVGSDTGGPLSRALLLPEVEMYSDTGSLFASAVFNARARGSTVRRRKEVTVDTGDLGVEHGLSLHIGRGPVTVRVGSTSGDDDYVSNSVLGTGYHSLAFTPTTNIHITLQTDDTVDRIVRGISFDDSGTVELTSPYGSANLNNIRYDQSADIVYVNCQSVKPHKIERRGSGRSWSIVEYEPTGGPYTSGRTSTAKLYVTGKLGNIKIKSDIPFFRETHVGSLVEITQDGQNNEYLLGNSQSTTDPIEVTGIYQSTATHDERRLVFNISGRYSGTVAMERSFDSPDFGYRTPQPSYIYNSSVAEDTGTFQKIIVDTDDNLTTWWRARMKDYTSGAATVTVDYETGSTTGQARVTKFLDSQTVEAEVIDQFSDTGLSEGWRESEWSGHRGYPTAIALHEGRLAHAGKANVWLSISDDYENFDDLIEGEAAAISRTLGSGPVDGIQYLLSVLRLIAGTSGSEIAIKSSSLDESLTPTNTSANSFSTQGSGQLRALKMDNKGLFVQRSGRKLFMLGLGLEQESYSDYGTVELSLLTPDIMKAGVVSIAIQRQPDTRVHCALADGTVAILTYEPKEEVLAWSRWATEGAVEQVMVLPGSEEDKVFYHVRRTINGQTKRYLEQWALEEECQGDTGLSWLADCAISYTDTGSNSTITDFAPHLAGEGVVVWGSDTGQDDAGKDFTPDDTGGDQALITVDTGGNLPMTDSGVHHIVAGLPYSSRFKSTKLAYGARGPTAMTMMKRVSALALILEQTHNNALTFGSDSGHLDPMPRVLDDGVEVDDDKIYGSFDKYAMPFDGEWGEDSRVIIEGKAPRPATVMAVLPKVTTNER